MVCGRVRVGCLIGFAGLGANATAGIPSLVANIVFARMGWFLYVIAGNGRLGSFGKFCDAGVVLENVSAGARGVAVAGWDNGRRCVAG